MTSKKIPTTVQEHLNHIATLKTELRDVEQSKLSEAVDILTLVGQDFDAIVEYVKSVTPEDKRDKVTVNGVFSEYERHLSFGRTVIVNAAHPFFMASQAGRLDEFMEKYLDKGMGAGVNRNADGSVKLRYDLFGQCVKAGLDGRWNKGGTIRKVSGNKKTDAQKIAAATETIDKLNTAWGGEFDLRYFEEQDIVDLEAALKAWHTLKDLGALTS